MEKANEELAKSPTNFLLSIAFVDFGVDGVDSLDESIGWPFRPLSFFILQYLSLQSVTKYTDFVGM